MSQETPTTEQILSAYAAEEAALTALCARIPDDSWDTLQRADGWTIHDIIAHIVDGTFGIPRLLTGGISPEGLDLNALNEQRRQQNHAIAHAEVVERIPQAFAAARAAAEQVTDLNAPGPFGPDRTVGQWLQIIAFHSASHRQEIDELLLPAATTPAS